MKKRILYFSLVGLILATLPALAQSVTSGFLTYGTGGAEVVSGTADQVAAMSHDGTVAEMKTLQGSDSTVSVTGATGLLSLSSKLVTQVSSSTGTITTVAHSFNVLSGSGATVDLPDATTFSGDVILVVNTSGGNQTLTPHEDQTINGSSTVTLAEAKAAIIVSDGANLHALTAITAG